MMADKQIEVVGQVHQRNINVGSKSEHEAVVLDTLGGESYELRLPGENPFELSANLTELVGKRLVTRGVASDSTLLIQNWRLEQPPISDPSKKSGDSG